MTISTNNTESKTDSKIPSPIPVVNEPDNSGLDDFGYTKEPETKTPDPKPEVKEPVTDEEKAKKELSEIVKDLPESVDKEKIVKFATENKLSKEQLQAYSQLVKEDQKLLQEGQETAIKTQRAEWKNELISDPEFGGENFDKNVDRVEKVLEKYMVNTKKVLTERGSMLPPYVMRDILALSKALNPVAPLVIGDAGQVESKDNNFLDDMYQ